MSVFPATDIVMDVAQAAEPSRLDAALKRLNNVAASSASGGERFGAIFSSVGAASPLPPPGDAPHNTVSFASTSAPAARSDPASAAAQKFEAFVLQTFIETMLPKEGSAVFGHDAGAGVWRSMMAEQLGNQIAKAGGIGLQKMLSHRLQELEAQKVSS